MSGLERFSDADRVSPVHRDAVVWAVELGLLEGDTSGRLRPRDGVERQQLASILWRQAGSPAVPDPDPVDPDPDPVDPPVDPPPAGTWEDAWATNDQDVIDGWYDDNAGLPPDVSEADLLPVGYAKLTPGWLDQHATSHPDHVFRRDGRWVVTMVRGTKLRLQTDDIDIDRFVVDHSDGGYGLAYHGTTAFNATVGGARITRGDIRGAGDNTDTNIGALLLSPKPTLVERVKAHGCRQSFRLERNNTYRYCHGGLVARSSGSHNTSMSTHGGANMLVDRCNLSDGTSSAFAAYPDSAIVDLTVADTLLNGGSYALHVLGDKPAQGQSRNLHYRGIRIGRLRHPDGGRYGPVQGMDRLRATSGYRFEDVRFLDGQPI